MKISPVFAAVLLSAGCRSDHVASTPLLKATPPLPPPAIRINAGATEPFTDPEGNVWLPDQGFDGGNIIERDSNLPIDGTMNPVIYRSEHYGMNSFSRALPNGKYAVRLYFAETSSNITGPGQRVFSFNVEGHEFKDWDVFDKFGSKHALVETVDVDVVDGKLDILFTAKTQNPEINGIEIIPR